MSWALLYIYRKVMKRLLAPQVPKLATTVSTWIGLGESYLYIAFYYACAIGQ